MDVKQYKQILDELNERMERELEEVREIRRDQVELLAELAALTVEPWDVDDAVDFAVMFNSADTNRDQEAELLRALKKLRKDLNREGEDIQWDDEVIEATVRAMS